MLAETTTEVVGVIVTLAFVAFVVGFVLYALVRPFTHVHHQHRAGLWQHLP